MARAVAALSVEAVNAAPPPKLELRAVTLAFGGLVALDNVDLAVAPAEIRGIIGPNGAGKTTLLNVITGINRPTSGEVVLDGQSVVGWKASRIAAHGIKRTFQSSLLFSGMTVEENVMTGLHGKLHATPFAAALGLRSVWADEKEAGERARSILDFVGMSQFADRDGAALSFGQQRVIEIARALVSEPQVLLLDEPAVGLSINRVGELDALLRRIRDERGVTIIMIEHVLRLVMNVCDRITVLSSGRKIAEGTGDEVVENPAVVEAYLGRKLDAQRS
jgi:branched-chain amino acid transport system ATP-binding protein